MKQPISWLRVEALQRKSITGKGLSDEEMSYVARALREDREKYRESHARVKQQEGNRVMGKDE